MRPFLRRRATGLIFLGASAIYRVRKRLVCEAFCSFTNRRVGSLGKRCISIYSRHFFIKTFRLLAKRSAYFEIVIVEPRQCIPNMFSKFVIRQRQSSLTKRTVDSCHLEVVWRYVLVSSLVQQRFDALQDFHDIVLSRYEAAIQTGQHHAPPLSMPSQLAAGVDPAVGDFP